MYFVELFGSAVFAMTGVIAVSKRGLDVIGALIRDRLLGVRHPARADDFQHAATVGTTLMIGVRALAIWFHLEMPGWLVKRD